jgi:S-adenosylmethionine/arginine decarboxylase-like enzyme
MADSGVHWSADALATVGLDDAEHVRDFVYHLADLTGLSLINLQVHELPNDEPCGPGVTALGMLKESHIAVHTWPEMGIVTVDVYSCRAYDVAAVRAFTSLAFGVCQYDSDVTRHRFGLSDSGQNDTSSPMRYLTQ